MEIAQVKPWRDLLRNRAPAHAFDGAMAQIGCGGLALHC